MDRSSIMRAVKSKNTSPELAVREIVKAIGVKFSLHSKTLPGQPDIVLPRRKIAVFVHGCFWHGHTCKRGARVPKTNRSYWLGKVARNKLRDRASVRALRHLGWKSINVWECQLRDPSRVERRLRVSLSK